jgi:hypothetical protein
MLVDLINAERIQHGIAPLSYSSLLANGTTTCIGAIGHATHMANDLHTIAHDQFPADVCAGYDVGENVGVSAYGSLYADAMQIHNGMAAEPWSMGCQGNHHCDWMDPNHTHVGIAFVPGTFQGLSAHYESEEYSNAG